MRNLLPKYKLNLAISSVLTIFIVCGSFAYGQTTSNSEFNIIKNGDFSSVVAPDYPAQWKYTRSVFGKATYSVKSIDNFSQNGSNALHVFISRKPLQGSHSLYQSGIKLKSGTAYGLTFKAGTELKPGIINVKIYDNSSKKSLLTSEKVFNVTQTPKTYSLTFSTPDTGSEISADLIFQFEGSAKSTFMLDDVVLVQTSSVSGPSGANPAPSPFENEASTAKAPISNVQKNGCDIYVSAEIGDDNNSGESQQVPVRTVSKAVSLVKDTELKRAICIQPATYNENLLISGLKGTSQSPYIIKSLGTDLAVISGQSYSLPLSNCVTEVKSISDSCLRVPLVSLAGSEYVVLDGLHIRESSGVGLRLIDSSHITVINSKISDNASFGILMANMNSKTTIDTTEVYKNFNIAALKNLPLGAGISLYSTKNDVILSEISIKNSKVHNNLGDGIFVGPNTKNILIESSVIHDNLKSNISALNMQNSQIKRNFLYCSADIANKRSQVSAKVSPTLSANMVISGTKTTFSENEVSQNLLVNNILANCPLNLTIDARGGPFARNTLINNTFVSQSGDEQVYVAEGEFPISSNSFVNNLLIQTAYKGMPSYVTLLLNRNILNKNLLILSQPAQSATGDALTVLHEQVAAQSTSSVELTPEKFKLQSNSRALDFGVDAEMLPEDDFFGNTRSGAPDAGAIEIGVQGVLGASVTSDSALTTIPVTSCTKYVNKDGNDSNGTSIETGYRTIQKGVQSLQARDVLCIKGGNYTEVVTVDKKFSEADKVKIGAYAGGGDVTIAGGSEKLPQSSCANFPNLANNETQTDNLFKSCSRKGIFNINASENVELVGVTISDSSATGLYVVDSKNIVLTSVDIKRSGLYGALFNDVESVNITKSRVLENVAYRKYNSKLSASGLIFENSSQEVTIADSLLFKNLGDGLILKNTSDVELHDSAIFDNAFTNLEIRNTNKFLLNRTLITCTSNGLDYIKTALGNSSDYAIGLSYFGVSRSSSSANAIVNSIIQGCKSNVILNADGDRYIRKLQVLNNHFINARSTNSSNDATRNVLLLGSNFPDLKFKNNIIYQKDNRIRTIVGYNTRYDFTANILYPNTIRTLAPPAFIVQNPKLDDGNAEINPNSLNVSKFIPKNDSPAINTADARIESSYLNVDYLKEERSNLDIGALEVIDADDDQNEGDGAGDGDDDGNDNDNNDGDGDGDSGDGNGDGAGDGIGDGTGDGDYDPCEYYWCEGDDSGSNYAYGSDYDYDYDGTEYDTEGYEGYDPYADYYYDFEYDSDDTAHFGVIEPLPTGDVLKNGNFDLSKAQNGLPAGWFIRTGVDGAVKVNLVSNDFDAEAGNAMQVQLKKLPAAGKVELFQSGLPLVAGRLYELSFLAKSDYGSDFDISLNNSVFPYEVLTNSLYGVDLKPDWTVYTGYIKIPETQSPNSNIRIVFSFDGAIDDLYFIDKVTMTEVFEPSSPFEDYEDPEYDPEFDPEYDPTDYYYTEPIPQSSPQNDPLDASSLPQSMLISTNKTASLARKSRLVYLADF